MIPTDAVLLGLAVVGIITATPVGIAGIAILLWGTRPRGRRSV